MKSYNLYQPVKRLYFTPDIVIFSGLLILLCPPMVESWIFTDSTHELSLFSKICTWLVILLLLVTIPFGLLSMYKYEPLKGVISGIISFGKNEIIANGISFLIKDITKISIRFSDYKGLHKTSRGFNGKLSFGVDNEILIYLSNGEKYKYQFQVEDRLGAEPLRDELINYYLSGKLHFLNLIELLNITGYNKIQEFKHKIGTFK